MLLLIAFGNKWEKGENIFLFFLELQLKASND